MEFHHHPLPKTLHHHPLPKTLTIPPTHTPPPFFHFCEKMCYRISIDYMQPFGDLRLPPKVVWEKSRGCNNPPQEDEGQKFQLYYYLYLNLNIIINSISFVLNFSYPAHLNNKINWPYLQRVASLSVYHCFPGEPSDQILDLFGPV